jgi:nucleoside-diphosphate-sugar epimerase
MIGGGRTTLPLVYASNVARGVVAALERPASIGRAYNLAMDTPISGRELVAIMGRVMGHSPRIIPVPGRAARAAAAAVTALTGALPFVRRSDLLRGVRALSTDNPYDVSRARLELGWTNHVAHEEGLRRALSEYR